MVKMYVPAIYKEVYVCIYTTFSIYWIYILIKSIFMYFYMIKAAKEKLCTCAKEIYTDRDTILSVSLSLSLCLATTGTIYMCAYYKKKKSCSSFR